MLQKLSEFKDLASGDWKALPLLEDWVSSTEELGEVFDFVQEEDGRGRQALRRGRSAQHRAQAVLFWQRVRHQERGVWVRP